MSNTLRNDGIEDVKAPELIDLQISPDLVDLTNGRANVEVALNLVDDLSGINSAFVHFYSPSSQQDAFRRLSLISGDTLDGVYQGTLSIPQFSENGTWAIRYVSFEDKVGNSGSLTESQLRNLGFDIEFEVVGIEDTQAPELTNVQVGPDIVDTGASNANIQVTLDLNDDVSGINSAFVHFYSPSSQQDVFRRLSLTSGDALDGVYQGTLSIPQFSENGTWATRYVNFEDKAGNSGSLTESQLRALGFDIEFEVVGNNPDELSSLGIMATDSSADENTGDTARYTLTRSGSAEELFVQLDLGLGSNLTTDDFSLSGGDISIDGTVATVLIPSNSGSVDIILTPTDDNRAEASETLFLSLIEDEAYTIDDAASGAEATIVINDLDRTLTTDEDTLLSGNVFADNNENTIESSPFTVTEVNGVAANVGSQLTLNSGAFLTLNSDGTFKYDPNNQFEALNDEETATDNITYTLNDGSGGMHTATATVTINGVTDANSSISGTVKDNEDRPLSGVTVELFSPGSDGALGTADDVLEDAQTTDANGSYTFANVEPGDYNVVETNPVELPFNVSDQDKSNDGDEADTDTNVDNIIGVTVQPGENDTDNNFVDVECFLTGTHILTDNGDVPVEALQIGDRVQTTNGTLEPIKWIGRQTTTTSQVRNPLRGLPILIKAGALGNHLPKRDLYVSPDHALLVDGLLINAGALVNDVSILKTQPAEAFTYYHIELDKHALLIAEGTAAESYLPQREDRYCYDNGAEYEELYPNQFNMILWPLDYPRVSSYTTVPRYVRKKLKAIAHSLSSEIECDRLV